MMDIPAIVANDDWRNAPRPNNNSLDTSCEWLLHLGPPRENASDDATNPMMKTTDFNDDKYIIIVVLINLY